MTRPFFTIAIPTKNRPRRVAEAVKSVLYQTFTDLEVVVCDNSDESDSAQTAAVVREFDDPRVRYVRTSGRLSMPDNWERAVAEASGQFVGILTDRSVFRRDALRAVHQDIVATGAQLVTWHNDLYGRDPAGVEFKRRASTLKRYQFTSDEIVSYFVHGHPKYAPKVVPKLMTSVCHRSMLDAIRNSPAGRCCPPVAPDFTSGFLMLAHCDWVLTIDDGLYVSVGTGHGADFRRRGELADRFRRDLGMEWHEMVDRMPSDACFAHALVLNDLMRVRDMVPDRLPGLEVDRVQYYLGCLNDYVKTSRHGVKRDEDLAALLNALEREGPDVQERVKTKRIYIVAAALDSSNGDDKVKVKSGKSDIESAPSFDNVFDALMWDEANPRPPAESSYMDLGIALEEMKDARKREKARVLAGLRGDTDAEVQLPTPEIEPADLPGSVSEEDGEAAPKQKQKQKHKDKRQRKKKKKPLSARMKRRVKRIRGRLSLRTRLRGLLRQGRG